MIFQFLTESELKHAEFMILNNNICKTVKDINFVLQEGLKNKNNNNKIKESLIKHNNKNNNYKEDNKKEDNKKKDNKKEDNKKNSNIYNYNLLLSFLLINRIINKKTKSKSIYTTYHNILL
jgi:hypothetical protein